MADLMLRKPLVGITVNRDYHRGRFWLPPSYCARIEEAGALPLLLPPLQSAAAAPLLDSLSGLLLSGGGDIASFYYGEEPGPDLNQVDPERDDWEIALVRAALSRGLPILGICRGMQLLNVALGGTLLNISGGPGRMQHHQRSPRRYPLHTVEILPRTRLASILGEGRLAVNSFHHQAPAVVAPLLRKAALSPDGVVEALENPAHHFLIGVQWHPESLQQPSAMLLFSAFVDAAAKRGGLLPAPPVGVEQSGPL
jgi:putative glutamine amidotransferase